MDPLTHTLVGAALARAGLEKRTALAMPTLVIGASLPDLDVLALAAGDDFGLAFRRGITHGLPALVLLPLALTLGMVSFERWRARRWGKGDIPIRPRQILFLSYLSVLTHPALDWLNTYGIRLLKPFSDRWFYGDSLFIIDVWVWLILGGSLFLGSSRQRRTSALWATLTLLATLLVLGGPNLLLGRPRLAAAQWIWILAIAAVFVLGQRLRPLSKERLAISALVAIGFYMASMVVGTRIAAAEVRSALAESGTAADDIMVGPVILDPLARQVVAGTSSGYRVGSHRWLRRPRLLLEEQERPRPPQTAIIRAAMSAPGARGFVLWARFPIADVTEHDDGYSVKLVDLRYARGHDSGFGVRTVELDARLNPR